MENINRYKVVFIGDCSVGKTCIIGRFTTKDYEMDYDATVGTDFITQIVDLDNSKIELQIWDTAGQERYRSLIPSYIRGASVVIIVYDVCDRVSFNNVDKWFKEVQDLDETLVYVVGNKVDEPQEVRKEEGMQKSYQLQCRFIETSAKKDIGIKDLFIDVAENLVNTPPKTSQTPIRIDVEKNSDGCC
ncbi:Rab6 [Entamoeba marina]